MKISAKTRYGLRILLDIALHGSDKPRTIRDIAASQQISEKFISPLVVTLRRAGMLRSIRGVAGGLQLDKDPQLISLLDISDAMDGEIFLLGCLKDPASCPRRNRCVTALVWNDVNESLREKLRSITLQSIIDQYVRGKLNEQTYSI
jgi:Rrf2 family protein